MEDFAWAPVLKNLDDLLASPSVHIGSVVTMTYDEAIIATNDFYVREAGGLPQRCFLLAVPTPLADEDSISEVVLLSVQSMTQLDSSREYQSVRENLALSGPNGQLDARTQSSLQNLGFKCSIVGTFYRDETGAYRFGGDVDRIRGNSIFKVYRPRGKALSLIASYSHPRPGQSNSAFDALDIGVVRYSETQMAPDSEARVFVNVEDFIGKKSALLGMTRTGKALEKDTRVPVPVSMKFPTGWALNHEIEIGDEVLSSNGDAVPVIDLTDWKTEPIFEVEFADGQIVKTAGSHLWRANSLRAYQSRGGWSKSANAKRARKAEKVNHITAVRNSFDSTTYASLEVLSELSGVSQSRLWDIAKYSGIESQLAVSQGKYGPMPKRILMKDRLYPAAELLTFAIASAERKGVPKNSEGGVERIVTTEKMFEAVHSANGRANWAVSLSTPMKSIQADVDLPIDPYVLGYWLGDGTSASGDIAVDDKSHEWDTEGRSDKEMLISQLQSADYEVTTYAHAPMRVHVDGLYRQLRLAGLLGNKHIPAAYLRASYSQRLALLQGLMDSDGTAGKNGLVGFGVSDKRLATDTLELVRSLGIRAKIRSRQGAYTHAETRERIICKTAYSIDFATKEPVFRLPRKLERQARLVGRSLPWTQIVDIRKVDEGSTRCLTVESPDSLHLVEGFIPTHNSNSMKTIIQKVFQYSHQPGRTPIGQIIFDPQGEYANVNSQDGNSALSQIGSDDDVRIYKMLFGKRESPKERHLQFNLFDEHNLDLTWRMMTGELRSGISGEANYIQPLFDLSFARPDDGSPKEAFGAFTRKQLALYALMGRSKFHSEVADFSIYLGEELAERAADQVDEVELDPNSKAKVVISSTYASVELFQFLMKYEQELPDFWKKDMKDGPVHEIKTQLLNLEEGRNGVIGAFNRIKPLHNTAAQGDVRDKIWHDLKLGRLVVVDLSKGSSRTTTTLSEMIVSYLVNEASKNFTSGADPLPFQIVVEEAHNLFRREGAKAEGVDPWVRLSKEAAKYSIGLVYATQEVTGVDSQILSNTSNWIVAHLNSRIETNELSKYYSFGAWADHLLKVETKGFVRMKTESSPYVVPVQIDRFVAQTHPEKVKPKTKTKKLAAEKTEAPIEPEPSTYSDAEYDELI